MAKALGKALGIVTYNDTRVFVEGLQQHRPIASFNFLGRYRLLDVPVSNMTNSGIDDIQVYVNGNPRSLFDHVGDGRMYNINSKHGSLSIIPLYKQGGMGSGMYTSDIESYYDNIDKIEESGYEYVVIAPSNVIYTCDYSALVDQHIASGAEISVLYANVKNANDAYINEDVLDLNKQKGVLKIDTNLGKYKNRALSLMTYVMSVETLVALIHKARQISSMYWLKDIINDSADTMDIRGIQYKGKFYYIDSLKSYFDANLGILDPANMKDFADPKWPIYTLSSDSAPALYFAGGSAVRSFVANGCQISGEVSNSVVGRGTIIGKGAKIDNCIIMEDVEIGPNAILSNVIVDKHTKIVNKKELVGESFAPLYIGRREKI